MAADDYDPRITVSEHALATEFLDGDVARYSVIVSVNAAESFLNQPPENYGSSRFPVMA